MDYEGENHRYNTSSVDLFSPAGVPDNKNSCCISRTLDEFAVSAAAPPLIVHDNLGVAVSKPVESVASTGKAHSQVDGCKSSFKAAAELASSARMQDDDVLLAYADERFLSPDSNILKHVQLLQINGSNVAAAGSVNEAISHDNKTTTTTRAVGGDEPASPEIDLIELDSVSSQLPARKSLQDPTAWVLPSVPIWDHGNRAELFPSSGTHPTVGRSRAGPPARDDTVRDQDGLDDDAALALGPGFGDNYDRLRPGTRIPHFRPQPGDIILTSRFRNANPLVPGGHVQFYKDDEFFAMLGFMEGFMEGDIVVRMGKFHVSQDRWDWVQSGQAEVFVYRSARTPPWFITARVASRPLHAPPDFFYDSALLVYNARLPDFQPRPGDLVIRIFAGFNGWACHWWDPDFRFRPQDMIVRAAYAPVQDSCCAIVEIYYRDSVDQYWSFRGRDTELFGGSVTLATLANIVPRPPPAVI